MDDSYLGEQLQDSRLWLVRLCLKFVEDRSVAEDLAQDTMLEAWRNRAKLVDPSGFRSWMFVIARHVCQRWRSKTYSDSRQYRVTAAGPEISSDIEVDMLDESGEVGDFEYLFERAVALIPDENRALLTEHYINNLSYAAIALRLGLTEGAVKMRVQRGKLALRRTIEMEFSEEAMACGILKPRNIWHQTGLWCPMCGIYNLEGLIDAGRCNFSLRCPHCFKAYGLFIARAESLPSLFGGTLGHRSLLSRLARQQVSRFRKALIERQLACAWCGTMVPIVNELPATLSPRYQETRGAHMSCSACQRVAHISVSGFVADNADYKRFWRKHPRLRTLPERIVEKNGRELLVIRKESIESRASLDILLDAKTYETLQIYCN